MKIARKLLITGGASLAMASGIIALPLAQAAGATQATAIEAVKNPQAKLEVGNEANASFGLKTEVDAGTHTIWATVTNKSDKTVVPDVTFNGEDPMYKSDIPLKPGDDIVLMYSFTGNYIPITVKVSGEGLESVQSTVRVTIQEPVTFRVTETNENVVIGQLQNNSSLVPQTVYTRINSGEVRVEHLEKGERRTIAIPQTAIDEQKFSLVTIANGSGYESVYTVPVDFKPILPVPIN